MIPPNLQWACTNFFDKFKKRYVPFTHDLIFDPGDNIMAYHTREIVAAINTLTPVEREYIYRRFWLDEVIGSDVWPEAQEKLRQLLVHLEGE